MDEEDQERIQKAIMAEIAKIPNPEQITEETVKKIAVYVLATDDIPQTNGDGELKLFSKFKIMSSICLVFGVV